MPAEPPRTLADQLRGWPDDRVARLLAERPDLASPPPQDSSQLASRVGIRASVVRAVDQLSLLELTVLDAALALGGTASVPDLRAAVNASPARVDTALERVRGLCLLWGTDASLRALSVLSDVLGTRISGLGSPTGTLLAGYGPARVTALAQQLGLAPSGDRHRDVAAIAALLADAAQVDRLVAQLDAPARAILEHLDREGKDGSVESTERSTSRGADVGPVDQLLARGLLMARDRRHVALPREVAICLRGGRTTRSAADAEPPLRTATRDPVLVDRTSAGAAFELVRHIELLLEQWGAAPPSALRTGGLAVRELKATAALLHMDERGAALHVEVAAAADLVGVGTGPDGDAVWLPTDAFDLWSGTSVAQRWTRLASAWLQLPRLTGLVGGREAGKPVNALAPGLERAWLPETRRAALAELAALEPGGVLAASGGTSSLVERLTWLRPRRPAARDTAVAWAVAEAALMGVTALGGMSTHGRSLLTSDDPGRQVAAVLEPLLPAPVDHVLLQADLTAVAPGPLEQHLARQLATVADVESRGGATVFRFCDRSVRRAFDSGWSAEEVHAFVASASRTPVPQSLSYLVDDVARRFGTIRVGAAESFLRSDDEAALAELVRHPRAESLRLRRIAPTVVVSDVPVDVLLSRLRELGTTPVVEAPDGTVRVARREALRARTPRRPLTGPEGSLQTARIASTVSAVRAGDRAAAARPQAAVLAAEPSTPAATLAVLHEAVESGGSVWLAYVDNQGSTVERVVDPVSVDAGWLSAYDHRTDGVRSFAVHRVSAVRRLET